MVRNLHCDIDIDFYFKEEYAVAYPKYFVDACKVVVFWL